MRHPPRAFPRLTFLTILPISLGEYFLDGRTSDEPSDRSGPLFRPEQWRGPSRERMTTHTEHRWSYSWLPGLIVGMILVALLTGLLGLRYVEGQLVANAGQSLAPTAAEIPQKLEFLRFTRYGAVQVLAGTIPWLGHDPRLWTAYVTVFKQGYPIHSWKGVSDSQGRILATTDQATGGMDVAKSEWLATMSADGGVFVREREPDAISSGIESVELAMALEAGNGSGRSEGLRP